MSGKFKKQLSLLDLTFIGLGAIFGSGWLFAASHVSAIAGPAGILSWFLGGFAVLLLGIVYCELGAALPRAGGVVRYPVYSHGPLLGYLMGFITLIAFSSLIAIEVVASRQYAAAWFPQLTKAGSSDPTVLGWLVQFALLGLFFVLNYRSVKTFAKANNLVSVFKFIVPLLVIGVLFTFFKPENFAVQGFAPFGLSGVEMAVSAGGVIFAYLGLTPIISVASEVKNPQRTIPIALILSVLLSTAIYSLLQLAFLGSVPTEMLTQGWAAVSKELALPYRDIALALGVGWLAYLVVADAVISPSGCGNIYMNATPRVVYGWAQTGTFFRYFTRIDEQSGIPRPALWLTFGLAVFWTLPFPSWEALINVVSAALVLSYAVAPVTVAALRRNAPDMPRPFRVKGMGVLGPLSFIIAALIVYWSGWSTVSWLLALQILMFVLYLLCARFVPTQHLSLGQQVRSSAWLIGFYAVTILLSWLGSFGGLGVIGHPLDTLAVAACALCIYYWGAATGVPAHLVRLEGEDESEAANDAPTGPHNAALPPDLMPTDKPMKTIHIIDSHTGGEPTRLVLDGFPALHGRDMAEQRDELRERHDHWRRACLLEPRGNDVLVGALYCPPVSPGATCGVIFFNNAGYLNMCGHGTIGLIASLQHLGRIAPGVHLIDTPVGQVSATLHDDGSVTVGNVPSYRYRRQVAVDLPGHGVVHGDIAWGGNWFFLVGEHGQRLELDNRDALTDYTWALLKALEAQGITGEHGAPIDHVELFADDPQADSRNFVMCPGKAYDRSPCGTGTSAKLACLAADGALAEGEVWVQASITGSQFQGRYERDGEHIRPFITGRAYMTADSTLLIDEQDPFAWGI